MVGVSHQGAHLAGGGWTVAHPVPCERARSSIEDPGAAPRHTSLLGRYSIEEEMYVHAWQLLGILEGFVSHYVAPLIIDRDLVNSHVEFARRDGCRGNQGGSRRLRGR